MSLLRRIERALAGREAPAGGEAGSEMAAGAGARAEAEDAGRGGGAVAAGAGARGEDGVGGRKVGEMAAGTGVRPEIEGRGVGGMAVGTGVSARPAAMAAAAGGEPVRALMASGTCSREQEAAGTNAARWIDPRVSGVYVLWSHRPRPAVRGARGRVGVPEPRPVAGEGAGAPAGGPGRAASAAHEVARTAARAVGGGAGEGDMSRGAGAAPWPGERAGGGGPVGDPSRVGAAAQVRAVQAEGARSRVDAVGAFGAVFGDRVKAPAGDRGFVREVTRWPLAGARPPLLAGRALALPGAEAWRAARRWLVAHGCEDMFEGALFLDVEATGLGHAAGTVAFVVGLARVAGAGVEVEQWALSRLSAEAAMLAEIAGRIAGAPLVTFNGASFDLPLLRGRLRRCGLDPAALAGPHLDLLPIARRLWRGRAPDCRLSTLERVELGAHRVGDIPGHAIPAVFWAALQRPECPQARAAVRKVCAHNVVDILAMPALARAMAAVLAAPHDLDLALRTSGHLAALGRRPEALAALEPWIDPLLAGGPVDVEDVAALREQRALRLAAALLRREGRRERAAAVREALRRRSSEAPASPR